MHRRLNFRDLQALVIVGTSNIAYLTGFRTTPYERLIALVLPAGGQPRLIVPSLEEEAARAAVRDGADCFVWRDDVGPADALTAAFEGVSGRVGVEEDQLSVSQLNLFRDAAPTCEFVGADHVLAEARIQKQNGELALLRRACAILDDAFARVAGEALIPGRTEADIADDCARFVREAGATTGGFHPSVLTGPRSALPHGRPGTTRLESGDLVIVDFGAAVEGYYSDATRTFVVGRGPDSRQHELLETVHRAEEAGIAAAVPGVPAAAVDRAARAVIDEAGFGSYFVHRTGHGLGLDVHEPPWLTASNSALLDDNMIVTVEPGIYIPGYGGVRIEDDVRVADPPERLTHAPIAY